MEEHRLRPKYMVFRLSESNQQMLGLGMKSTDPDNVNSPFVLMPRKDPAAYGALLFYAALCEPQLGNELRAWLRSIARAEPSYGTQGKRNRTAMQLKQVLQSEG